MVKHKLWKSIHIHYSNLTFVYVIEFDVETALENSKLLILERLEFSLLSPNHSEAQITKFLSGKFWFIMTRLFLVANNQFILIFFREKLASVLNVTDRKVSLESFFSFYCAIMVFRSEGQPKHLKRWFFLKNRPIHRTNVIRQVK